MGVAKKADGWHPIDAADSRQPQFIERKANCLSMRASSGDFVPGRVELGGTPSVKGQGLRPTRSEEHTSELQSLMRISYAVFCLKKKNLTQPHNRKEHTIKCNNYMQNITQRTHHNND